MSQAVVPIPTFIGIGNRCPGCFNKPEIIGITDKFVHINCARCTWAELFLALYVTDPSYVPWAYEEAPAVHPF